MVSENGSPHLALLYSGDLSTAGGGAVVCKELAEVLRRRASITVLSVAPFGAEATASGEYVAVRARRIYYLAGLEMALRLWRDHRRRPLDAVLFVSWEGWALPLILPGVPRVALAIAPYAHWLRPRQRSLAKGLARRFFWLAPIRSANAVLPPSKAARDVIQALCGVSPDRMEVVPHGVNEKFFDVKPIEPSDDLRVLYIGSLDYAKGIDDAVEACRQTSQVPQMKVTLRVLGPGEQDRFAGCAGANFEILFDGPVDRDEVVAAMAWASVVLLPSYGETFGLAAAEAQAAGRPVVAYEVDSARELIENGVSGVLVPVGDISSLVAALLRLAGSHSLARRLGDEARVQARQRTWERAADQILATVTRFRRS